ncbi:MAG: guanylate kinase [Rhodobacteraceae bacterium]|nr:guanylate kinase [Paracoccaceae bacterium]
MFVDPRRGLLIILSSPSGAGKTTLTNKLVEWDSRITISVSMTTRPARGNEQDGKEYFFVDDDTFLRKVGDNVFLEHAEVFGYRYGTPARLVENAIEDGRDVVFDIDWKGANQIRNSRYASSVVSIFVLPPSIAELNRRLRERAFDSPSMVGHRMEKSKGEISHWLDYDYVLINHEVEQVLDKVKLIVQAERMKRTRQRGLRRFIGGLNSEFEARRQ